MLGRPSKDRRGPTNDQRSGWADGKAALHLGGRNEETGRRRGFTIEGNVHPSFTPGDAALFITGGLGYDWL